MNASIDSLVFVLGASLGSFINVIVLRYNPDKSLWSIVYGPSSISRSHCHHCQKTLQWYELVPIVSFFVQGGRCRSCQKKLSWQYPFVEILMGVLAVMLWQFISPIGLIGQISLILTLFLVASLVTIALIDLRATIIPDELVMTSLALILIMMSLRALTKQSLGNFEIPASPLGFLGMTRPDMFVSHLFGAALGGGFLSALWFLGRGRWMGLGDGKLGLVLGLWLGFPTILLALAMAFMSGTIVAVTLLGLGKKTLKDAIPLGPFLVLGGLSGFLLGGWFAGWWRIFTP